MTGFSSARDPTMCGRFTLSNPARVAAAFDLVEPIPELRPRYNVAPSQLVAVVWNGESGRRELTSLTWNLLPSWATPGERKPPVNAKAETLSEKPSYRKLIKTRRCLIPADGYYEWTLVKKKKVPWHICLNDRGPMGFAGLWDLWTDGTKVERTCCLITTAANELARTIHDRMPLIIPRPQFDAWLDPKASVPAVDAMLSSPFPADQMEVVPANPLANGTKVDGPELLVADPRMPKAPLRQLSLFDD